VPMIRASWQLSASIAAALVLVHLVCRVSGRPGLTKVRAFTLEFAIVAGIFAAYQHTVGYAHTRVVGAREHALQLWDLERALHLPSELALQHLVLHWRLLVEGFNLYYAGMHLTSMTAFLVWLWWRHRDAYPLARTTVAVTTLACVLVQMVPVAPPRLLPELGFVDTGVVYGLSMYGPMGTGIAGQLAAMPSIHIAWAAIIAVFAVRVSTSPWRWLLVGHFVMTCVVVVATANHWWLDGVVGIAFAAAAAALHVGAVRVHDRLVSNPEVVLVPEPATANVIDQA
jgi:hypothetical protein